MSENKENLVIEAAGLSKNFKDFWGRSKAKAVNGISFNVTSGQVFGLLGPNGSGKSTTVKMILGLLYPSRGMLKVFGKDPQNVDVKSRIGYLPEETYLYKYLTAMETLDFFGALFGLEAKQRKERSEQLLEMVGLAQSINRPVGEFSKGMARRIGLAQALINDPDLVILDEPTSGLDPLGCREVKDVIRLLASRGKTIILCSHLLADVQDVCDEVMVLYGGKIRAKGAMKEILMEEDKTSIIAPRLSESAVKELREWFVAHGVKGSALQMDHPSRDLEEFFLDVVKKAQEQSVKTAGASSGGEVPAYLMANVKEGKSEAILDALRRPAEQPQESAEKKAEKKKEVVKKSIDLKKLESLKMPKLEKKEKVSVSPEEIKRKKEEENKKLSKLLNKK
ncbi:MAG: ABC transporter ATP-binding protein [Lentisphaeria bacterium]